MGIIKLTGATIGIGGVDVTDYVREGPTIVMEQAPYVPREPLTPLFTGFRLSFQGTTDALHPRTYHRLLGRQHPRIRRMHAAYGRRRGW